MTPQNRNRLIAVGALVIAAGGLGAVAYGNLGDSLVYYWSPHELLTKGDSAIGPTIRLGGIVKAGTINWNPDKQLLEFDCAADHKPDAAFVHVRSEGVPPQMFRDGIGVVVEGTWDKSQTFTSARLMVNHSNEYKKSPHGEDPAPISPAIPTQGSQPVQQAAAAPTPTTEAAAPAPTAANAEAKATP